MCEKLKIVIPTEWDERCFCFLNLGAPATCILCENKVKTNKCLCRKLNTEINNLCLGLHNSHSNALFILNEATKKVRKKKGVSN